MMRKVMYQLSSYILLFSLLLLLFSCYREDKCPEKTYLPVDVSPIQLEYKVGDTITINSKFPRSLKDISGDAYTYEGEFLCYFGLVPIDSVYKKLSQTSKYIELIQYDLDKLEHFYSKDSDAYYIDYCDYKDTLNLNLKFITSKPGIVYLALKAGGAGPPIEASKNCIRGWKNAPPWVISMNGGVNYNFELLSEVDSTIVQNIQRDPQDWNEKGGYLMKIVE